MASESGTGVAVPAAWLREIVMVVGIAAVGVLIAVVLVFGPWPAAGAEHAPVIRFNPPAVAAPHG
ncbi:MAG: hypothetical protein QOI74_289 [Micromonosporaceae bacterium]|jgi:hypothetical protein|nr:hypothetical protein [Micromonosporaceae bacterium]MDT5036684.1 hypothetical protein [Micromonosporaceae bacterium]